MNTLSKYFYVFKLSVQDMFSDTGKTFIWMIIGGVEAFVMAFTWFVISDEGELIGGLIRGEVISYYLFINIAWYIIGGTFHQIISSRIKDGTFANELTKPIFPYAFSILKEQGWKFFGLVTNIVIVFAFWLFFRGLIVVDFELNSLLIIFPTVILGALIFGLMQFIIGNMAMCFDSSEGVHNVINSLFYIFGGIIAPLALLPDLVYKIAVLMPFRYTFSFPIEILQNQLSQGELINGFMVQIGWVLILLLIARIVYLQGLIKFESYGN